MITIPESNSPDIRAKAFFNDMIIHSLDMRLKGLITEAESAKRIDMCQYFFKKIDKKLIS